MTISVSPVRNYGSVAGIDRLYTDVSCRLREMFTHIVTADRDRVWQSDGCRDMAQWLAGRLGMSNWAASRWVKSAHALEDLPAIAAAFEKGALGVDKVVELTRFATPEAEAKLIKWAQRVTPATIRDRADVANRSSLEDHGDAHRHRFLDIATTPRAPCGASRGPSPPTTGRGS